MPAIGLAGIVMEILSGKEKPGGCCNRQIPGISRRA